MKKILLSAFFALVALTISGADDALMFRVTLRDKVGSPCSLQHPEQFLSQRALQRRQRQHLPLDSTDLPLSTVYLDAIAAHGVKIVARSKWNNSVLVASDSLALLQRLDGLPFVVKLDELQTLPADKFESKRGRLNDEDWTTVSNAYLNLSK